MEKKFSFINRKRPAVEGLIEDFLGPVGQLDEIISGNPLPFAKEAKAEDEDDRDWKSKNKPG
ncbi:MAG: hypothetical protein ACM3YE_06765 [Bacteroidota bacterium]